MGLFWTRPSMGYMLTQVFYCERRVPFHISTKMHLLEFSTCSWLPSVRLSYIVAFNHVGHCAGLNYIMTPEVQNHIKCSNHVIFLLFNYMTKSAMFTRLWMMCRPFLFRREKISFAFQTTRLNWSIDRSFCRVGELNSELLSCFD